MALIKPFKGVVYNPDKLKNLSAVVAPPYDIIQKTMQDELYRRHKHNVVRLILGKKNQSDTADDNRYTRAKASFESWLRGRVMIQDEKDALYIYSQDYEDNGIRIERVGFIARMKLDAGKKRILPHENTLAAPKIDRLDLIRSVRANLSPIFVLYEDPSHKVVNMLKKICRQRKPFIDIDTDNVRHRVWRLEDKKIIGLIDSVVSKKNIFIADGHHRYEVAVTFALEIQDKDLSFKLKRNSRFMMAYFVESDEHMLTILPTHRLIKNTGLLKKDDIKKRLEEFFRVERVKSLITLLRKMRALKNNCAFGLYFGDGIYYLVKLRSYSVTDKLISNKSPNRKRLDVTILHMFLLERVLGIRDDEDNIEYIRDAKEAAHSVDEKKFKMAFFLNPTKASEVRRVAKAGERMPRKATYFYPKPLSGLVINKLY